MSKTVTLKSILSEMPFDSAHNHSKQFIFIENGDRINLGTTFPKIKDQINPDIINISGNTIMSTQYQDSSIFGKSI